eukprot:CAMPEP_0170164350 /NCGR_PEP_ID=MMETSP0033_2-20121228/78020_1 /TAXON_ID=195969 /ORGANISM="Dolichomastix tenuilepis, Strain CCMP3274" /LENGTH=486 /DNA_ID=CAMNT_0010401993 /DNA_START=599 /DNA_END=2056 /DNA_ORIENTATION=+
MGILVIAMLLGLLNPRADAFPVLVDGRGNITIRSMSALSMESAHPIELHTKVHANEGIHLPVSSSITFGSENRTSDNRLEDRDNEGIHLPVSSSITFGSENRTSENRLEDRNGHSIRLIGEESASIQTRQTYVETRDGVIYIVVNKTVVASATELSFDVADLKVTGRVILPGQSRLEADDLIIAATSKVSILVGDPFGGGGYMVLDSSSAHFASELTVDGNVAVGTTHPESQLHVVGRAQLDGNVHAAYNGGRLGVGTQTPEKKLHVVGDAKLSGAVHVAYEGGRLGVGTQDPEAKFHVEGNAVFSNFMEVRGNSQFGNYLGIGNAGDEYNYASLILANASRTVKWEIAHSKRDDSTHEGMLVHHWHDGAWTRPLTITHDDRVGIGTSDPKDRLHVAGGHVRVAGNIAIEHTIPLLSFEDTDGFVNQNDGKTIIRGGPGSNQALNVIWYDRAASSSNYLATILNNGNVGIGTTDPQATLHVNGNLR